MKTILPRCATLLLAASLLALSFIPARADVAPPEAPAGSTLWPGGETTQVSMLAETVTLSVSGGSTATQHAAARTSASFTMRNLGTEAEKLQVRFPLRFMDYDDGVYPEISGIQARVNGQAVPTHREIISYSSPGRDDWTRDFPWAVFEVSFPPAEDVHIEVAYSTSGYGYYPYEVFRYILETGAGWKGPIGSADIIVRLPYAATEQNVAMPGVETGYGETTKGLTLSGNEARWHFEDLEPTANDNIAIALISPFLWQSILKETDRVKGSPSDGEAWGRLGKDYKEIYRLYKGWPREDPAGQQMYDLSKQAYEKSVALLPNDSLWHTGYADLLWSHYYFDIHAHNRPDEEGVLSTILSELHKALELDANNQLAKDLLDWISSEVPEAVQKTDAGYNFLQLTPTAIPPTPAPTWTPAPRTATPTATGTEAAATFTPVPVALPSPQPVSTPAGKVANPLCGGPALLLAGLAIAARHKRRK